MFSFLDPKEDAIEKSKFLTAFCKGVTEQNNMLHLTQLGAELSEKVLQYWMANINRSLSNYQVTFFTTFLLQANLNLRNFYA